MDAPTLIHPPTFGAEGGLSSETATVHPVCDECASPVAAEQRYCVNCGAHRRNVNDPAARYLGHASAQARRAGGAVDTAVTIRSRGRGLGIGTALVLAAIPVAAGLGVLAGGSSGSGDAALVRALAHQSAADNSVLQALGTGTSSASSDTPVASSGTSSKHAARQHGKHHAAAKAASASGKAAGPALSTTKPSQAQVQSGASVVQKIQKSAGKGYVNSQSGLPGTIVVP